MGVVVDGNKYKQTNGNAESNKIYVLLIIIMNSKSLNTTTFFKSSNKGPTYGQLCAVENLI